MGKKDEFIARVSEQVANRSIYIWGAQGQIYPTLTEAWIRKKESGSNETKALKTYRRAVAAGKEKVCRAFDCSGLGIWALQQLGIIKTDMTANGMKGKCTLIQRSHLKKGDWVFRTYKTGSKKGRAYHIGYVVDDSLNVVHAKGRAYGVVQEKFKASYWNTCGRPGYFAAEIDTPEEQAEHAVFNRSLKKGMKGDDVRELQKLLNTAGDSIAVDGDFGSRTLAAVKAFQKRAGLRVDGIAGPLTAAALKAAADEAADKPAEHSKAEVWSVSRKLRLTAPMMRGEDVRAVQTALIAAGYGCGADGADGIYGSDTKNAVRSFQKAKKLTVDGIAGKNTVTALGGRWEG